jgi:hypothetical protein
MVAYNVYYCKNIMSEKRAYFTPSPIEVPTLLAKVMFAGITELPRVTFYIDSPEHTDEAGLPALEEITLDPLEKVCATNTGFELTGSPTERAGMIGRLAIDTTVQPPLAVYSETPADS